MDRLHDLSRLFSTRDVWLIGYHDQKITGMSEAIDPNGNVFIDFEISYLLGWVWLAVLDDWLVNHSVAVEKN